MLCTYCPLCAWIVVFNSHLFLHRRMDVVDHDFLFRDCHVNSVGYQHGIHDIKILSNTIFRCALLGLH